MVKLLMHKNDVVAKLNCTEFYLKNIEIINENLMPFAVSKNEKHNNDLFFNWKKSRMYPISPQKFKNSKLSQFGKTYEAISNYINASLIDCYWFKSDKSNITWEDVSYYHNPIMEQENNSITLSEKMYKYSDSTDFLTKAFNSKQGYKKTIEYFTTDINGKYCIVKSGNMLNKGFEVFCDIIGDILCDSLELDAHQYYLMPHKIEFNNSSAIVPLSASEICIQDDSEEIVIVDNIINTSKITKDNIFQYLVLLNLDNTINKLLVLDFLTLNSKRSLSDLMLIRDSNSLQIKSFAPVFSFDGMFNGHVVKSKFDDPSSLFLDRQLRQIKLVDDFSFVDIEHLRESLNYVDAVISYSALNKKEKENILNTLDSRISLLDNIIKNKDNNSSIKKYKIAQNIKRRFNVDEIIQFTNLDPIFEQSPESLFINYLSASGSREFEKFKVDITSLKERFDLFKNDTLLA